MAKRVWTQEQLERKNAKERERYAADPEWRERRKEASKARYAAKKEELKAKQRAWNKANPDKIRAYNIKKTYGLTIAEWDSMLIAQSGRCGICSDPMTNPHVDHCHTTNAVRELLCTRCNSGLGQFRDNTTLLGEAIAYLTRHQEATS